MEVEEELKESEQLDVIFEHIDNELVNDGNYASEDEALENGYEVLTPTEIGLNTTKTLAIKLFNYKRKIWII